MASLLFTLEALLLDVEADAVAIVVDVVAFVTLDCGVIGVLLDMIDWLLGMTLTFASDNIITT